jgi:hypothetical protein
MTWRWFIGSEPKDLNPNPQHPYKKLDMALYMPVTLVLWRTETEGSLGLLACLASGSVKDFVSREYNREWYNRIHKVLLSFQYMCASKGTYVCI